MEKLPKKRVWGWKYKEEDFPRIAYQLTLLGATDKELAIAFGVDPMTIDYWKRTKEEFKGALQAGKLEADSEATESFFKCVNGYEYEEEVAHVVKGEVVITTIKRFKGPDAWAAAKWLSLRRRGDWSETHKVEVTNTNVNINKMVFEGLTVEEIKLIAGIGIKQKQLSPDVGSN